MLDGAADWFLAKGKRYENVAHNGDRFHARSSIWFKDVEEDAVETFGEFEFAFHGPKKPFP